MKALWQSRPIVHLYEGRDIRLFNGLQELKVPVVQRPQIGTSHYQIQVVSLVTFAGDAAAGRPDLGLRDVLAQKPLKNVPVSLRQM